MPKSLRDHPVFTKLHSRQRATLAAFFIIIFLIGFIGGAIYTWSRQKTKTPLSKPTVSSVSRTSLVLEPINQTLRVGEKTRVKALISGMATQAVDIVLDYDPSLLTIESLENGKIFPLLLQRKIEEGKVYFSASLDPKNPQMSSQNGEVFTIVVRAKSATSSALLEFNPQKTQTAKDGKNILGITVNANYTIIK